MEETPPAAGRPPRLGLVHALVLASGFGAMAQAPLQPYLVQRLAASAAERSSGAGAAEAADRHHAGLQTAYSVAQLAGALAFGPLVDRRGPAAGLLVSLLGAAASWGATAAARSVGELYLAKALLAAQQTVMCARGVVTLATRPESRSRQLGFVGMSFGLGFALGPAVGGALGKRRGPQFVSAAAAGLAAASAALVAAGLVGGVGPPPAGRGGAATPAPPGLAGWLAPFRAVAKMPAIRRLLAIKLLGGVGFSLFQSSFALVLKNVFALDPRTNGLVMSFVGLNVIVSQAGLVGWLAKTYGEAKAQRICAAGLAVTYLALAGTSTRFDAFLALLVPLCLLGGSFGTINTAALTKAAPADQVGVVLSLDMALGTAVRIGSPLAAVWLLERSGSAGVFGCCAALNAVLYGFMAVGRAGGEEEAKAKAS